MPKLISRRAVAGMAVAMMTTMVLAACGGGGAKSQTDIQNTTVSKGQAIIDLQNARKSGAITQSEFDAQRAKILAQ